ncbi:hypothetical protein PAXRUDRAFT_833788, partial [Paxillus rubicundulus Ve08.2h10]
MTIPAIVPGCTVEEASPEVGVLVGVTIEVTVTTTTGIVESQRNMSESPTGDVDEEMRASYSLVPAL